MDTIKIQILDDGTIKVDTDPISVSNHVNAEGLIREMVKLAGGEAERKNKHGQTHTHNGQDWHRSDEAHH